MSRSAIATPAFVLAFAACTVSVPAQEAVVPAATPAVTDTATVSAAHGVRIVRLSEVNGTVQLDRGTNQFEPAFNNLPIVQGARLRTGDGTAEVEFEDGSSLRLTPNSQVEFHVLSAEPNGDRETRVHASAGGLYASAVKPQRGAANVKASIVLAFGNHTVTLDPGAHIALSMSPGQPRLDILDGAARVTTGRTLQVVEKKKGLLFEDTAEPKLVSKREPGPFDDWDKRSVQYHSQFASMNQMRGSGYQYGVADLNYYGSFMGGSCSGMWRPYFASANWSPYSNGVWAYYPSAGYSYVSQYPWAWAPYHSGSWSYCPGVGYGWTPGAGWYGLSNVVAANTPTRTGPVGPNQLRPPHPPTPGPGRGLVPVSTGPVVASGIATESHSFTFRNDSAGLGVPRAVFGKLNGMSSHTEQHGSLNREVYLASPSSAAAASVVAQGHALAATHITASAHTPQMSNPTGVAAGTGYSPSHGGPVGMPSSAGLGGGASAGGAHGGGSGGSGAHH